MRVLGVDWRLDVKSREKTFAGHVTIRLEGAVRPLVLDSSQLTIVGATLDGKPTPFEEDRPHGKLRFPEVPTGACRLEIAYHGAVEENSLIGLYPSPCGSGFALTTMMFPTGSGRLLPSFEHPSVKTVYRLTLTVDAAATVVFNTAVERERLVQGRRELAFAPTPPMSAYLLYLGIGPFDTLTVPGDRWSVTVATSPGRASAGRYCAERTAELLTAYEVYYGMPYPLPKLDLIALENFWAGAMENWGAIAFRENALLVDASTSALERRAALSALAHEIAHQWFGNLVTPADWDDFWLNESFATFVGYRIMTRRYPEQNAEAAFLSRWVQLALEEDSLAATHPVKVAVGSPEALGEVSDEVTYGKGAAVLRMIEAYLGENTFRQGVSRYLARHQFANARAHDLWAALDEVSARPVSRILTEWITRPGYPVVQVHWASGALTLRQQRFRADGTLSAERWPVPLRIVTSDVDRTLLFEGPETTVPLPSIRGLRINPGRTAFVRVQYDGPLFASVLADFPVMEPADQWGLIADTLAFLYAGQRPLEDFLQLLRAGEGLSAELPVRTLVLAVRELRRILYDVPEFLSASRRFLRHQLEALGLDPRDREPDGHAVLRELTAMTLASLDEDFARELAPRFATFDRLPGELRRPVAVAFARAEGAAALAPLIARLQSTHVESERAQMAHALASFRDPALLQQVLDAGPSSLMTPGGSLELLMWLADNPTAGGPLFDWYCRQSASIVQMWAGTPLLSIFLRQGIVGMGLERASEVERYFGEHSVPDAAVGIQQGLEALRLATRLRERVRADRSR